MTTNFFNPETVYVDSDKELDLIANKHKRAQWRHRRVGPSFIKMGRKIGYLGEDLNAWMNANRVEIPVTTGADNSAASAGS
jgi:hypothetical protein